MASYGSGERGAGGRAGVGNGRSRTKRARGCSGAGLFGVDTAINVGAGGAAGCANCGWSNTVGGGRACGRVERAQEGRWRWLRSTALLFMFTALRRCGLRARVRNGRLSMLFATNTERAGVWAVEAQAGVKRGRARCLCGVVVFFGGGVKGRRALRFGESGGRTVVVGRAHVAVVSRLRAFVSRLAGSVSGAHHGAAGNARARRQQVGINAGQARATFAYGKRRRRLRDGGWRLAFVEGHKPAQCAGTANPGGSGGRRAAHSDGRRRQKRRSSPASGAGGGKGRARAARRRNGN